MINMENKTIKHFEILNNIDVSAKVERKETGKTSLTYLSWAWAWAETKKRFPSATYGIIKNENGLPYVYDELTGYMVNTWVEIEDIRYEMWLPVMDGSNKAMKSKPYSITTKKGYEIKVEPATMFDVNKTIMRCLTKNLAMFGMGLYIYAGEDLPEQSNIEDLPENEKPNQNKKYESKVTDIDTEILTKVKKILWYASDKNKEKSLELLEEYTKFTGKDGKEVPGLREFEKLSNGRLKATYGKLQKKFPELYKRVKEETKFKKEAS